MNTNRMTEEQRIERAHVRLMNAPETLAYAGVIMVGESRIREDIPTACTNGRDKYYGRAFVSRLSDPELCGLVLHENLHVCFQQLSVWKKLWEIDAQTANQAADYVINMYIKDIEKQKPDLIKLPPQGLYDPAYRNMDTKEVFDLLRKNGQGKGKGQGSGASLDEHDVHGLEEMTPEEQQALAQEIDQAIRQGALMAGKMGGKVDRALLALTDPQVNWREQLQEFMTAAAQGRDDSTWRKPSRRWLGEDIYLPSAISTGMDSLVVFVDTSGSISDAVLSLFLGEVLALCNAVKPQTVHFIAVDATIQLHNIYDENNWYQIANIKRLPGGGGTDMREVFKHLEKNNITPNAVVGLTDGMTPWPDTLKFPTLWAITDKSITAPIGATVHIKE